MRKFLIYLPMLFICSTSEASIKEWFMNPDQKGYQRLSEGNAEEASKHFHDPNWRGVAHYRAGHYKMAIKDFKSTPTIRNRFNLGNTYAQLGDFDQAIAAYESVLKDDPKHKDAQENLALVKSLQKKKEMPQNKNQQQSQQSKEQQQNQNAPSGQKGNTENSPSPEQNQASQDPTPTQKPFKNQMESTQKNSTSSKPSTHKAPSQLSQAKQEQMQSNQQWLKRIQEQPDELLKHKFLRDYLKRKRQGGRDETAEPEDYPL